MSKFVNSIYSPNKSGRLGASVFGKNKFGPFEKMLGFPSNPRTDEQVNRRSQFSALSRKWGSLTDAQRTGWDDLAKDYPITNKGMSYTLTGFMFFMMLNGNLQVIGEPIIEDAVRLAAPQTFDSFSASIDEAPGAEDITLDFSPAISSGTKLQVYACRKLKPGRKAADKDMRLITVKDHTFVTGDSIKTAYIAKFGAMPGTGDKVCFRIKATNIADGLAALPLSSTVIGTV